MFGNYRPVSEGPLAFPWRPDDGPLILAFGSSLPHQLKKYVVKVGHPLTKFSGSGYVSMSVKITLWKSLAEKLPEFFFLFVSNKCPDQTALPCNLTSASIIHFYNTYMYIVNIDAKSNCIDTTDKFSNHRVHDMRRQTKQAIM